MAAQAKTTELAIQVTEHERRISKVESKVDCLDEKIDKITTILTSQAVYIKIGIWIFSAVGISIIGLIWAILTHSIELVRP